MHRHQVDRADPGERRSLSRHAGSAKRDV